MPLRFSCARFTSDPIKYIYIYVHSIGSSVKEGNESNHTTVSDIILVAAAAVGFWSVSFPMVDNVEKHDTSDTHIHNTVQNKASVLHLLSQSPVVDQEKERERLLTLCVSIEILLYCDSRESLGDVQNATSVLCVLLDIRY
jgi:hypothetical protein